MPINRFRKFIFWLWPPYEAAIARNIIENNSGSNHIGRMNSIKNSIRDSLSDGIELPNEMENLAKTIFDIENKRRETLESKAIEFVSGFGIAVSVFSALPALFDNKWRLSILFLFILGVLYFLGIMHLLVAIYWAVAVRRAEGLALPNVDGYMKAIADQAFSSRDRIIMYLSQAKFNEPLLTLKANSLSIAERMFIRGIFFVALVALFSGSKMVLSTNSSQVSACQVPNVLALDKTAAEKLLVELGLQPIISNQYDDHVKAGVVIDQDPIAGSRIQPCNADVVIIVSLGAITTPTNMPTSTHTFLLTDTPTPKNLKIVTPNP